MAEHEVIRHIRKIKHAYNDKEKKGWHKAKEIALEILIIVFAVTLSIALHNWSEHNHKQEAAKKFLIGLRSDIQEDIMETKILINLYKGYDSLYTYLYHLDSNTTPHVDSLNWALGSISNNVFLRPNMTRFNGFYTAGKLEAIDDDSLVMKILQVYQEDIAKIKSSENFWVANNKELQNYLVDNIKSLDDKSHWEVLITPKGKILCKRLIPWPQLYDRYRGFIQSGEDIIRHIDDFLKK